MYLMVGKPTATFLTCVSLLGAAESITAQTLDDTGHDSSRMAATDAGPLGGTIVPERGHGGYLVLNTRQHVEPSVRRYVGGSISDYYR